MAAIQSRLVALFAILALSLANIPACLGADLDSTSVAQGALEADDQCDAGAQDDACALSALQLRGQMMSPSDSPPSSVDSNAFAAFNCRSNLSLATVRNAGKKGMCLDDTTFELCSGELPEYWPHTGTKVTSMRIFKAWGVAPPTIFHTDRLAAWANVKAFAQRNGVKFLIGTSVGCDKAGDETEWQLARQFMAFVGPQHIMGLAVGNELELLYMKSGEYQNPECLKGLFEGRVYEREFYRRVAEMDKMPGFSGIPVTAVFGMYVMAGQPFVQQWNSGIAEFLKAVWHTYGQRFVFSFNLYPYFDPSSRCTPASIRAATDFHSGMVPGSARAVRLRMQAMGAGTARLWVGETGWSTPESASVAAMAAGCADFSSASTFKNFYNNFLDWDLASAGVDHVFYFTIHDSKNFDAPEHFGLIGECGSAQCKLQS